MFKLRNSYFIVQQDDIPKVRLGICCINNGLRKRDIFCSRTMISRTYSINRARELVTQNLTDLKTILLWNRDNNIGHYRLSSDMFPRITDPELAPEKRLKIADFKDLLVDAGTVAKETGHRITMHPGQYNQIGAQSSAVFEKTVEDLSVHCEILDTMGMDENSIITIHGGGVYGDKENTIRRWIEQFGDLPRSVKNRLTIENCERQYNIEDCLYIAEECRIPVIFDSHHFTCYNQIYNTEFVAEDYISPVLESWWDRRMVCHISEQKPEARIGAHSDFIETIPSYFLSIPSVYGVSVDIEVEAKAKEAAIFKLYDKYPHLIQK